MRSPIRSPMRSQRARWGPWGMCKPKLLVNLEHVKSIVSYWSGFYPATADNCLFLCHLLATDRLYSSSSVSRNPDTWTLKTDRQPTNPNFSFSGFIFVPISYLISVLFLSPCFCSYPISCLTNTNGNENPFFSVPTQRRHASRDKKCLQII